MENLSQRPVCVLILVGTVLVSGPLLAQVSQVATTTPVFGQEPASAMAFDHYGLVDSVEVDLNITNRSESVRLSGPGGASVTLIDLASLYVIERDIYARVYESALSSCSSVCSPPTNCGSPGAPVECYPDLGNLDTDFDGESSTAIPWVLSLHDPTGPTPKRGVPESVIRDWTLTLHMPPLIFADGFESSDARFWSN